MEKPTPKFKVGDTIYFRSNWFAGSYIPDMMTVFGVRVVEEDGEWHVKYRKKRMRWEIDERDAFATEAEAQKHEINSFVERTKQTLSDLLAACREEGVETEAVLMLSNSQNYIGNEEDPISDKFRFEVGDEVWGYQDKRHYEYVPQKYIITQRFMSADNNGVYGWVYNVKGHGTAVVYGETLRATRKESVLASVEDFIRYTTGVLETIEIMCNRLQIEFKNPLLLPNS